MSECSCTEYSAALSRRGFLKGVGAAAAITGLAAASNTQYAWGAPGGHVLVVLSLRGGFDGLNAIAPVGDPLYQAARPHSGVPASRAFQLDSRFGLHPALAPLQGLWNDSQMAVVHAVGQANPTRSHFAAMSEMERAAPGSSLRTGWIDRALGGINASGPLATMELGASRPSGMFNGPHAEVTVQDLSSLHFDYAVNDAEADAWSTSLQEMYRGAPGVTHPDHKQWLELTASSASQAVVQAGRVRKNDPIPGDKEYTGGPGIPQDKGYPQVKQDDDVTRSMMDVARLIRAGVGLRVAAVDFAEWDMHANAGTIDSGWQKDHFTRLAANIAAFKNDIGPDHWNNTTVITLSEFGRRVAENGSGGTDHGFGNAVLLFGGQVRGKQIYGNWPGLAANQLVDGDLNGTTDYRTIVAEVLNKRMGIGDVGGVFPGLSYSPLGVLR